MNLRNLVIAAVIVLFSTAAFSQRGGNTAWKKYRHEASVGYGVNNVFAALGEDDKFDFNYIFQRSTFNASYRYYFMKHFAARGSITHAFARKNDKEQTGEERLNARLDYTATITEFAALAEYHIIDETTKGKRGKVRRARGGVSKGLNLGISLYTGLAVNYLRPYGEYFGQPVELKPITSPLTVPNNDQYKRVNLAVPVGSTVRILVNENWRVGLEVGYRIGFREYVDNVSGVYLRNDDAFNPDPTTPDPKYIGNVTFAKEEAPIADLASDKGKRNYLFGGITLAYRLKL